jgi:hypothetical protein
MNLKHFFYLEYKNKKEKNPVIYSRFGKKSYQADEKFLPEKITEAS